MAVVKTPQQSHIGIKVANGVSASGAAQYRTLRYSNVKPATSDHDMLDVAVNIAGLQGSSGESGSRGCAYFNQEKYTF